MARRCIGCAENSQRVKPDHSLRQFLLLALVAGLSACATVQVAPESCPPGTRKLENCPPIGAIDDPAIAELYALRTWRSSGDLDADPVEYGRDARIPINNARAKFIGSSREGGLILLAAKLHIIEQAEHTIDAVYYIFRDDIVGLAVLGALCDAVERGVDIISDRIALPVCCPIYGQEQEYRARRGARPAGVAGHGELPATQDL